MYGFRVGWPADPAGVLVQGFSWDQDPGGPGEGDEEFADEPVEGCALAPQVRSAG